MKSGLSSTLWQQGVAMPCPCRRFSSTREPFSTAHGYGMKHDKANMLYSSKCNHVGFPSMQLPSIMHWTPPHGSIRCLFMAWFLDSKDTQVLYIFLWLQVSNQPDQACWSQSGMPSGWGKGATPWPARLRLVRDDRGSWAAPATLGQPSYHHFWSTVLTPQFCCINTILWYYQTYDPCDMFHFKPPS